MSAVTVGTATISTALVANNNTFPNSQGNSGQVLQTNGAGVVSWTDMAASGGAVEGFANSSSAISGTITLDVKTQSVYHYTANSGGTWTFNFRGDASTSMNSFLGNNETITVVAFVPCNNNGHYNNGWQIDGSGVTPKWIGGFGTPTGGHSGGVDVYTFTILKTGSAAYSVYANQNYYS